MVKFELKHGEKGRFDAVMKRAFRELKVRDKDERLSLSMDILAAHSNGCPLDFRRLLVADGFNFLHDICGISRHICRETGQLQNFFLPRFALKGGA